MESRLTFTLNVQGIKVNFYDGTGVPSSYCSEPLLFTAICEANFQSVLALLNAGANPNIRNRDNRTPLMWAVNIDDATIRNNIVGLLIRFGATA